MQLDNTRIAVRERGMLDTFDLALRVVRQQAAPILFGFVALAAPLFLLNHWLLAWMISTENRELYYLDDFDMLVRYCWDMGLLIAIEAPLASVLATAYLGQAMFIAHPAWRTILSDVARMLPRIVWCFVLARGIAAAWLLLIALDGYGEFDPMIELLGMGLLAMYVFGMRFWRPYLAEIILLERNPLLSGDSSVITVARRSRLLHSPSSADLFFRGLVTTLLAVLLTGAVFGTFLFASGVLFNTWQPDPSALAILIPMSMWIVAAYLTVVRFLSYLDLRIRHEGWEVELRLRAEGERLRGKLT